MKGLLYFSGFFLGWSSRPSLVFRELNALTWPTCIWFLLSFRSCFFMKVLFSRGSGQFPPPQWYRLLSLLYLLITRRSLVNVNLEHCVVQLWQLDFNHFWNFTNVIHNSYNDIEPGILRNLSLQGLTGNNHANKTPYLCGSSVVLVAIYLFIAVGLFFFPLSLLKPMELSWVNMSITREIISNTVNTGECFPKERQHNGYLSMLDKLSRELAQGRTHFIFSLIMFKTQTHPFM